MSTLYIPQHETMEIKAFELHEIERCVNEAMNQRHANGLFDLKLLSCGQHIGNQLRKYERDLENFGKAKAAQKRSETQSRAWNSGHDLIYAVRDMKQRVEEQEKETQQLRIDDAIAPPYRFNDKIDVSVSYQWRRKVQDPWAYGSITFSHNVDMRPDYTLAQPKRKPSATKAEKQRQDKLYSHWEHLRTLALHAVREFLKSGGDGTAIPESFKTKPDTHGRYLNNFSCNFWLDQETKMN